MGLASPRPSVEADDGEQSRLAAPTTSRCAGVSKRATTQSRTMGTVAANGQDRGRGARQRADGRLDLSKENWDQGHDVGLVAQPAVMPATG